MTGLASSRLTYGIRQACETTGLGRSKLYQEISEGRLRTFKVGSRTLIAAEDLSEWLNSYRDGNIPNETFRKAVE